ncbi:PAS domain S-box-containing protein/diguanylate cyclase (GGDEF) domain-containing protein [Nitrosospira briensis]|uniref:PAS domain S-box-containing protein/diguanylate cyclase (GGDEF) domain-containing protein n=1 Tax=Nitrosospira briensis TaxID=35799 RepID=A0A1I5C8L3_9PROT|nr:diguanylate cyclase [Nitrosospira briensis]SFN83363.1 PAS domain S-box-containing protein/diguanylate cyclase (GGDEF) domain-containing protein [Nitrosospira briensis]
MDTKPYPPLARFIDQLLDAICVVDGEGRFIFVSAACERIFGYTPKEMVGKAMLEMVVPEDRARTLQAANEIMSGHPTRDFENRYMRKDGQVVHIMWSARWSEADQLRIAVARDITERKQAQSMQAALYAISEAAHTAEDLLSLFQLIHQIIGQLLSATNFFVAIHDESNDKLSFPYYKGDHDEASEQQQTFVSTLCAEVIRSRQPLLLRPESLAGLPEQLRSVHAGNGACWLAVPLNSHNGTIGALALKSNPTGARYTEKDKELLQFVSTQVATAIERKQLHARLEHMAQYDGLTGLPNRGLLHDRLKMSLARTRREQGQMSLLYLDLNNFKQVNDSLGHAAGDALLQEVANRLKQCVRDLDTVARMGGDEFVVLLENIQLPEHASNVAKKIRSVISQPMKIEDCSLCILPSIGIALYPDHGDEAQQLLRHADQAMYFEKKNSENYFSNQGSFRQPRSTVSSNRTFD